MSKKSDLHPFIFMLILILIFISKKYIKINCMLFTTNSNVVTDCFILKLYLSNSCKNSVLQLFFFFISIVSEKNDQLFIFNYTDIFIYKQRNYTVILQVRMRASWFFFCCCKKKSFVLMVE